jgi:hypothetical protein
MRNPHAAGAGASNRLAGHSEASTPNNSNFQANDDTAAWSRDLALAAANWLAVRRRQVRR